MTVMATPDEARPGPSSLMHAVDGQPILFARGALVFLGNEDFGQLRMELRVRDTRGASARRRPTIDAVGRET